MRALFLGKKDDAHCAKALAFIRANADTTACLGTWGGGLPEEARYWEGDLIVSYLSRWVVPKRLLDRAATAINFHPASPEYPGIGCTNFALYDEAKEYGATCHFMAPKVDTGAIIATKRFHVLPCDDVASLLARTYDYQLALFLEVMDRFLAGEPLVPNGEQWGRAAYTRDEFNELGKIRPGMSHDEVRRRVRATSFGVWQPVVEVGGFVFKYDPAAAPPKAPAKVTLAA